MRLGAAMYRRLTWLLLWTMVFGAMAPTLTHGLASGRQAVQHVVWTEICRPGGGTQRIALDVGISANADTSSAPLSPSTAPRNHCDYCLLTQHLPFLPMHQIVWRMPAASHLADRIPAHDRIVFPTRFPRDAHPTRAPPGALTFAA